MLMESFLSVNIDFFSFTIKLFRAILISDKENEQDHEAVFVCKDKFGQSL